MENLAVKIDLKKMKNAGLMNINGRTGKKRCVVIPVDDNPGIFVGEKGIYLSLSIVELSNQSQYGDTHLVKQSIPSETYRNMSEDERNSYPILGNARPLVRKSQEMPVQGSASAVQDDDDLPF